MTKEESAKKDEPKKKAKHHHDSRKEAFELRETLQRLQAEFENYRKRTEKEKEEFCRYAERSLLIKVLPVLDHLELSLKNTKDAKQFETGIRMVVEQFRAILRDAGLKEIKTEGEMFNPTMHEAIAKEESDRVGVVLEEFQKGYLQGEHVLRHSKVKVGVKHDNKTDSKGGDTKEGECVQ